MFGVSFSEFVLVAIVALVAVGPQRLPGMMRTLGEWLGKLRRMVTDMRVTTGIDDILREEGIDGVAELRSLLKGELAAARRAPTTSRVHDPYYSTTPPDVADEYPAEGVDSSGALPDDLEAKNAPDEPDAPLADAPVESEPALPHVELPAIIEPAAPLETAVLEQVVLEPAVLEEAGQATEAPAPSIDTSELPVPPGPRRVSLPRAVTAPETPISRHKDGSES